MEHQSEQQQPGQQQPEQPPAATGQSGTAGGVSADERTWGMLCHLSAFAGFLIPFGSVIGPLVIWLIKKEEMPFVNDQGKEALNFQITMAIAFIVSAILVVVLIGLLLLPALAIFDVVMVIIASIKANEGATYRYPYSLRLIK